MNGCKYVTVQSQMKTKTMEKQYIRIKSIENIGRQPLLHLNELFVGLIIRSSLGPPSECLMQSERRLNGE